MQISFIPDISTASLQVHYYSGSLPASWSNDTALELTRQSAAGNYKWRTCPRSIRGGQSGIRTCALSDARHWTYHM